VGPNSYYKDLTVSQGEDDEIPCIWAPKTIQLGKKEAHFETGVLLPEVSLKGGKGEAGS
jgi:hypothetical protein